MYRYALILLLPVLWSAATATEPDPSPSLPTAAEARAAFAKFAADPVHRLDATGPFLDFIRSSGEIHIVLNDALLAWMYSDFDEHNKAVLYAAFLGGNMNGQLTSGTSGSDDVAGIRSTLHAYARLRELQPEFRLTQLDELASAAAAGTLPAAVQAIVGGDPKP